MPSDCVTCIDDSSRLRGVLETIPWRREFEKKKKKEREAREKGVKFSRSRGPFVLVFKLSTHHTEDGLL